MCIVCEIKKELNESAATDEQKLSIFKKIETVADALHEALRVASEIHNANPNAFTDEQFNRMQAVADITKNQSIPEAIKQAIDNIVNSQFIKDPSPLDPVQGNSPVVDLSIHRVEMRPGETVEQALQRGISEINAADEAKDQTKH